MAADRRKPKVPGTSEFGARPSECGRFCVISIVTDSADVSLEFDRNETARLAVTLNCMAASLKEPPRGR